MRICLPNGNKEKIDNMKSNKVILNFNKIIKMVITLKNFITIKASCLYTAWYEFMKNPKLLSAWMERNEKIWINAWNDKDCIHNFISFQVHLLITIIRIFLFLFSYSCLLRYCCCCCFCCSFAINFSFIYIFSFMQCTWWGWIIHVYFLYVWENI